MFSFNHVFVSSCFHFFIFSILLVFISSCVHFFRCFYYRLYLCCYRECYGFERFLLSGIFYLTLLPAFIKASLVLGVQSGRLQGFPLRFETQTQPICLFESLSVQQLYDKHGTLLKLVKIC